MGRIANILVALFLLSTSLRAEVYSIDFNLDTRITGTNIATTLNSSTNPDLYCNTGSAFVNLHENTRKCFYNIRGCGIRIGATDGDGWFVLTLDTAPVYVSKIVVYASKTAGNTISELTVKRGSTLVETIGNSELKVYSTSEPASDNYKLPEVAIGQSFVNLQLIAPKNGYVILHRLDIYTGAEGDEDAMDFPRASFDEMDGFCNLAGQRVSNPSRGIYIKGGKKYVIK